MNIDHIEALAMLEAAYALIAVFEQTIDETLEGDHPDKQDVADWLENYDAHNV